MTLGYLTIALIFRTRADMINVVHCYCMEQSEATPNLSPLVRSHDTSHDIDYVVEEEQRLAVLGSKDDKATDIFRKHILPGQDRTVLHDGAMVPEVRAIIDPEEYVIPVNNISELTALAKQDHARIAEGWRKYGTTGEPPVYTFMEIIIGDPSAPESCYRLRLLDANQTDQADVISLLIERNLQFEKSPDVLRPIYQASPNTTDVALPPQGVIVNPDIFDESQNAIMRSPDLSNNLAFGYRTGEVIEHQRRPKGTTRYEETSATMEVPLETQHLWVVVLDGERYAQSRLQKQNSRQNS
jgi:hypothetical protein